MHGKNPTQPTQFYIGGVERVVSGSIRPDFAGLGLSRTRPMTSRFFVLRLGSFFRGIRVGTIFVMLGSMVLPVKLWKARVAPFGELDPFQIVVQIQILILLNVGWAYIFCGLKHGVFLTKAWCILFYNAWCIKHGIILLLLL